MGRRAKTTVYSRRKSAKRKSRELRESRKKRENKKQDIDSNSDTNAEECCLQMDSHQTSNSDATNTRYHEGSQPNMSNVDNVAHAVSSHDERTCESNALHQSHRNDSAHNKVKSCSGNNNVQSSSLIDKEGDDEGVSMEEICENPVYCNSKSADVKAYDVVILNKNKLSFDAQRDSATPRSSKRKRSSHSSSSIDSGCNSDEIDSCDEGDEKEDDESCQSNMGRFIVDPVHFSRKIAETFEQHRQDLMGCTIKQWKLKRCRHSGLVTEFTFQCVNCLNTDKFLSEAYEEDSMDLNTACIAGTLASGIGHTQLEQIFGSMGIHCMSDKMYSQKQSNVCQKTFEKAARKSMDEAIAEEIKFAKENGKLNKQGIPLITVIIDGSWLKRTYGSHWNSCSGTAAIIGAHTGKVLFFGIRNKYCLQCARAANQSRQSKYHVCYKNWDSSRPSTAMESDIILEGFRESITRYGVIYDTVIMDNDSSLYKAIVDSKVYVRYNIVPKRILCSVHLSKSMCKKLRKASESSQTTVKGKRGIGVARELIKKNVETMRLRLKECIECRSKEETDWQVKILHLRYDILNIPSHVFGEHKMCNQLGRICIRSRKKNSVPLLKSFGLYDKVEKVFRDLSCHSESLLHQKSTNIVELLNSMICRALGGKRINWGLKSQYITRVTGQVVQFNTGNAMSKFYEAKETKIPEVLKKVESKRQAKAMETRNRRNRYGHAKGGRKKPSFQSKEAGKFYGNKRQDVDFTAEDMIFQSDLWLNDLKEFQEKSEETEKETRDRSNSQLWVSLKKKMLHSEHFQLACTWKASTNCENRVKKILYPSLKINPETEVYLLDKEKLWKEEIARKKNCVVTNCGVFIDDKYSFLGTSPTALVGDDGIMQVVCPFDVANLTVKDAVAKNAELKKMFAKSDTDVLNTKSEIYYAIQGALHITKKKYCLLIISTNVDDKFITVEVDEQFWKDNMERQLCTFFHDCLLPELVDSRFNRNMSIRNPPETCKMLEKKEEKKKEDDASLSKRETGKKKIENSTEPDDCQYVGTFKIKQRSPMSIEHFRNWVDRRLISYHYVRTILLTPYKWLDDDVLDRLVCMFNVKSNDKECPFEIQSSMYIERPDAVNTATRSFVQIIGGNCINHWRTAYFDCKNKNLCIYDSLKNSGKLSANEMKYLRRRTGIDNLKSRDITFKLMKVYQNDGASCGLFAAAYAVSLYFGEDPAEINYVSHNMALRRHYLKIMKSHTIERFPTT